MAEESKFIMSTRKELLKKCELLCKDGRSLVASFAFGKDNILFMQISRRKDTILLGDSLKFVKNILLLLFLFIININDIPSWSECDFRFASKLFFGIIKE